MGSFSIYHWVIVLIVVVLVFGPKRLASVGQGLGEGIRSLRDGLKDEGPEKKAQESDAPGSRNS
jgi:sec-independent protein translocase protein TatA